MMVKQSKTPGRIPERSKPFFARKVVAVALVTVFLAILPASADYEAAMSYYRQGKWVEAASEFEHVVHNAPEYDFGFFMLGNCYAQLKKYRSAIQKYRDAIKINPGKVNYHMMLAQIQFRLKDYNDVVTTLDTAEPLATDAATKAKLTMLRGQALYMIKDYDRALVDLRKSNPAKNHSIASLIANICFKQNDYACAEKALGQAKALKPKDKASLQLLATIHLEQAARERNKAAKTAKYAKAEKSVRAWAEADPGNTRIAAKLGSALLGAKKYEAALVEFKKALKADPQNCNIVKNITSCYNGLSQAENLFTWGKKLSECAPKDYTGYYQMGQAKFIEKDFESAKAFAKKSLSVEDNAAAKKLIADADLGIEAVALNAAVDADAERVRREQEAEKARLAELKKKREEYEAKTGLKSQEGKDQEEDSDGDL